ncbi:SDR family oxidoreductase [Trinickia sp. NRRL B-1857]|uniref:SDR family oxidoreductase n=1 Tax=Trinickia sp. NRRL B-1857 TaxID=3162879 RepID=UPI003D2D293A
MTLFPRIVLAASVACFMTACAHMGPARLKADQVDYTRALGMAKKRAILDSMVQLRFADAPSFLTVSQIIAAYTFDASAGATLNEGSGAQPSYALANGSVSYSNHPTFTFPPTTGDAFAAAYIRPLAPALVQPLAQGGIPIDLLLRIAAQSVAGLRNGTALGGSRSAGTPGFFQLLHAARRLAAIANFTKCLATQLIERGIRVNGVAPGPFWTPLQVTGSQTTENVQKFGEQVPMKRPGQPAELAPVYVLLASAEASYITGQIYGAMGGKGQP